ncbi:MAG: DUF2142 domain-containing protein [Coriobacteriaceae bacterium]|nr:DUF2142 domain-containing protein [Coriobacteriaceae bacterium]
MSISWFRQKKNTLIPAVLTVFGLLTVSFIFFSIVKPQALLQANEPQLIYAYFIAAALPLIVLLPLIWHLIFVRKAKLHNIFLVAAILMGVPQALANTPNSWYDEQTHFYNALYHADTIFSGAESQADSKYLIWERRVDDTSSGTTAHTVTMQDYEYTAAHFFDLALDPEARQTEVIARQTSPYQYLPQILGIGLAHVLNLGQIPTFYLARLFNFVFFLASMYLIIKKAPFKTLFCLMGLMPFVLGTATSCSYDNPINILIFAFSAFLLHLALEKSAVTRKDILILTTLFALFAPLKFIYFPLVFLLLLVPKQKFTSRGDRTMAWALPILAGLLMVLLGSNNLFNEVSNMGDTSAFNDARQLDTYTYGFILQQPGAATRIILATALDNLSEILNGPRYLYVMKGDLPIWTSLLIMVILLIAANDTLSKDKLDVTARHKMIILIICAVIYLLSIVALLTHTEVGAYLVQGVQGRYYIPLLPLVALLGQRFLRPSSTSRDYLVFIMVLLNLYTVGFLFQHALVA